MTVTDEMSRIRICSSEVWIRGSGSVPSGIKDQGSGIRDQGSGIRDQGSRVRDQGPGIRDQRWVKIRIRDKHPGSATLLTKQGIKGLKKIYENENSNARYAPMGWRTICPSGVMTQPPQAAARFGSIVGTRPCIIIHLHYIIRRETPLTMTAPNCSCMPPHFSNLGSVWDSNMKLTPWAVPYVKGEFPKIFLFSCSQSQDNVKDDKQQGA